MNEIENNVSLPLYPRIVDFGDEMCCDEWKSVCPDCGVMLCVFCEIECPECWGSIF